MCVTVVKWSREIKGLILVVHVCVFS